MTSVTAMMTLTISVRSTLAPRERSVETVALSFAATDLNKAVRPS